jgi:protease I
MEPIVVFVEDQYEELEAWYPIHRLAEENHDVLVVGPEARTYRGLHDYPIEAQVAARDVRSEDVGGVIVPGGYAPDLLRCDPDVLRLVADSCRDGKLTAAICHAAAWVLASAGVLDGRRATCLHRVKDDLVNAGASYEDAAVVRDGNLVTSRTPDDLPAFSREILAVLRERAAAPAPAVSGGAAR